MHERFKIVPLNNLNSNRYFKISAVLVFVLLLVQVVATTYKSYAIGYIPTWVSVVLARQFGVIFICSLDDQLEQLDSIYDLPWNRLGPYVVGLATGYFLVVKLQNKLILKEVISPSLLKVSTQKNNKNHF